MMVVFDNICSTCGELHCFVMAVVCFCLGAHWQIVGEGLRRHITVEPLLPAAWILSHLTLLGLDHHWQGQRLTAFFGLHAETGQLSPPDRLPINPQQFILGADWPTNQLRTRSWVNFLWLRHSLLFLFTEWFPKWVLIWLPVLHYPRLLLRWSFHWVIQFLPFLSSLISLHLRRSVCPAAILDDAPLAAFLHPTLPDVVVHGASPAVSRLLPFQWDSSNRSSRGMGVASLTRDRIPLIWAKPLIHFLRCPFPLIFHHKQGRS